MRFVTIALVGFFTLFYPLGASELPSDNELREMIGRMLIVGFDGETADENSTISKDIKRFNLGGVILFDRYYYDKNKTKNISSPEQLASLTASLKAASAKPLLISVDQEGGKVARLKPAYGFTAIPSAARVAELDEYMSRHVYNAMARSLKESGINCDFAPVLDLAINPKNSVIVGLGRSYSEESADVSKYATIMLDSLAKEKVIGVGKHFPGHGSSEGDSHKGFVDVTKTWSEKELEPYTNLIKADKLQMIMTAHVFNKNLDPLYPATLSHAVNTKLLREKMGFKGVIVSDDLQMSAISAEYKLSDALVLAINSGVDMLLIGNQLLEYRTDEVVETIFKSVKNGEISYERVKESNERIGRLF